MKVYLKKNPSTLGLEMTESLSWMDFDLIHSYDAGHLFQL